MKVIDLPQLHQVYEYDCGAAALQAVLVYYGIEVGEGNIIKDAKTSKTGTCMQGMIRVIHEYNLQCICKQMTIEEVKKFIKKRIPVILVLQAWSLEKEPDWANDWIDGHYVVAIGYSKDKILFEDPLSFERTFLRYVELEKRWHDVDNRGNKYEHYGIAVFGQKPKYDKRKIIHMD